MSNGIAGRIFKFQVVGAAGVLVQLGSLACFHGWLGWQLSIATAAAVEAAILHNFVWHLRWTWKARNRQHSIMQLLWRYNLTYSLISITGNLACMYLFMQALHVDYLIANLLAIGAGGVANFLTGEFLLFRSTSAEHEKAS